MSIENTLMAEPKVNKKEGITAEELAAVKEMTIRDVEAGLSSNPKEKYRPGSLKETDADYINQVSAEVERRMADPKYVAETRAHLADINRPGRSWN